MLKKEIWKTNLYLIFAEMNEFDMDSVQNWTENKLADMNVKWVKNIDKPKKH